MVKITVGNNMKRIPVIVEDDATPRQVFEQNDIDYSHGMSTLDGATLGPGDLDKTFSQLGITEKGFLYNVAKLDNAGC